MTQPLLTLQVAASTLVSLRTSAMVSTPTAVATMSLSGLAPSSSTGSSSADLSQHPFTVMFLTHPLLVPRMLSSAAATLPASSQTSTWYSAPNFVVPGLAPQVSTTRPPVQRLLVPISPRIKTADKTLDRTHLSTPTSKKSTGH